MTGWLHAVAARQPGVSEGLIEEVVRCGAQRKSQTLVVSGEEQAR